MRRSKLANPARSIPGLAINEVGTRSVSGSRGLEMTGALTEKVGELGPEW
jgi:hypothetical protein